MSEVTSPAGVRLKTSKKVDIQKLRPLLVSVCEMLLQCTREQPSVQELRLAREQQELAEKSFMNTDHRVKLQIVCCCTVEELIHHLQSWQTWLSVLQEHMILPALLSSADIYLKVQEGLHYMQPLFSLFITIAQHDKSKRPILIPQQVTWHGVYCLCLELYTTLLAKLKYSFLEDAFNFVGCHQDRLQQCLEGARFSLCSDSFREVERTCVFVSQLANFSRDWRLHLPEPLNKILTSLLFMCQTFVSYLIRPRYLQHILEHQGSEKQVRKGVRDRIPVPSLQHQASTDDIENPTSQHISAQHSMLKVLGECFVALRQFSPDLVQILVDQNMDVGEYEPFLAIGFSTPPVDHDTPPTFGTMLSCVTVSLRMLSKMDANRSPQRSEQTSTTQQLSTIPKWLIMFVMENALYLTMSQGMLYLKDPEVTQRDKQLLKRELGTEMNSILSGIQRYIRRGGPQSPAGSTQPSPRTQQSPAGATLSRSISQTFLSNQDHAIFRLV